MGLAVAMDQETRSIIYGSVGSCSEGDGEGAEASTLVRLADFPVAFRDGTFTGNFFPSRVILTF